MALRKGGEVRNARLSELRQAGGVALLHSVVEAHGGTDGRIRRLGLGLGVRVRVRRAPLTAVARR